MVDGEQTQVYSLFSDHRPLIPCASVPGRRVAGDNIGSDGMSVAEKVPQARCPRPVHGFERAVQ